MAIVYCDSSATGTNDGSTKVNAVPTWQGAFDRVGVLAEDSQILISHVHNGDAEANADKTFSPPAFNVEAISINFSNDALTPMDPTTGWIGNSSASMGIIQNGPGTTKKLKLRGIAFRLSGGNARTVNFGGTTDSQDIEYEDCAIHSTNSNSASAITIGASGSSMNTHVKWKNVTVRLGHANQAISVRSAFTWEGGGYLSAGSVPVAAIQAGASNTWQIVDSVDLSHVGTAALTSNDTASPGITKYINCKVASGFDETRIQATQTLGNRSAHETWVMDCFSDGTAGYFGYANALGSMISKTSIKVTASVAGQSWKIVGNANATRAVPFLTPWIRTHWTGTSAITPYAEVLRDDGTTARTNAEIFAEVAAIVGSDRRMTFYSDKAVDLASPANQADGAGLGAWEGESGTAKSMKLDAGQAITPSLAGDLRMRFGVCGALTLYVDPVIRT